MKLEYFILGLLQLNPMTGYDLKKFLDTEGRFVRQRTPLSQIYTTLGRMADDGLLVFHTQPQEGKPDRKIYAITPAGKAYLVDWLSAPHEPSFRFQDRELLGKITFSHNIDKATILEHLETELAYRKKQIAAFRGRERKMEIDPASGVDLERVQPVWELLHTYGAGSIDHYVDWLEKAIEFFEQHQ